MLTTLATSLVLALMLQVPNDQCDHLRGSSFTIVWNAAPDFDPRAELEIGTGSGHGFSMRWLRFRPEKDDVEVLSVDLRLKLTKAQLKETPIRPPVVIQSARLPSADYAALLRQLAIVSAAQLQPIQRQSFSMSSNNFWVAARLETDHERLFQLDWAGYQGSLGEIDYAKPRAMTTSALVAVQKLEFKEHELTKDDRAWAKAKFVRDGKLFEKSESHWWVRDRYRTIINAIDE